MTAFSEAGFHAVAPDLRGYGDTDAPQGVEKYTVLHIVGDLIGLLDSLQCQKVCKSRLSMIVHSLVQLKKQIRRCGLVLTRCL